MFTAITSMKNSVSLLKEITKDGTLGDAVKGMVDALDDYVNGNPYDYEVTVKAIKVLNNLDAAMYNYAVEHYGKEYIDKWITPPPTDDRVDPDEEYGYLMRDVCF